MNELDDATKMTKQDAGRKGGLSTVQRCGKEYMRLIGRRGARSTWSKYRLVPVSLNNFAMMDRATGEIKAYLVPERR